MFMNSIFYMDSLPTNAGKPWTSESDKALINALATTATVSDIALQFQRTQGSIVARQNHIACALVHNGDSIENASLVTRLTIQEVEQALSRYKTKATSRPKVDVLPIITQLAEEVFSILRCGLSERVYHNAMEIQLREKGIQYETERMIHLMFKKHVVGFVRADLLVNRSIVVELKAVPKTKQEHIDQCARYMKLLKYPTGVVINFPDTGSEIEVTEVVLDDTSDNSV